MLDGKKRKREYDVLKGMGIILVVLGHSITKHFAAENILANYLRTLIYLIHMPLFFCVAGILYEISKERYGNKVRYIKKKFCLYIIPYISFSLIIYFLSFIGSNTPVLNKVFSSIGLGFPGFYSTILGIFTYTNHMDGHLWFAPVMFLVLCMMRLSDNIIPFRIQMILALIVHFFSRMYLAHIGINEIIWKTGMYYLIFCTGRLLSKRENNYNLLVELGSSVIFVLLVIPRLILCGAETTLIKCVLEYCIGILGTLILYRIACCINENSIGRYLSYVGRNSYIIYFLHHPYIVLTVETLLGLINVPWYCCIVFATVLGTVIPLIINKTIIQKSWLLKKVLLGS